MSPASDAELVERFNGGDDDAFRILYERYRDWVYRLAWRFTAREADALDVLSETFSYLLSRRGNLYLSAKMTTFLYPVVRNQSLLANRKRRRIGHVGLAEIADPPSLSPAPRDLKPLAEALDSLTEQHREIVLLRFAHDMALADIAAALEIPVGTVKSRLHHALERLREHPAARSYFRQSRESP